MKIHKIHIVCVWIVVFATAPLLAQNAVEYSLDNGLFVRIQPLKEGEKAAVILHLNAGVIDEPEDKPHLAHVTEHMVVHDVPEKFQKTLQALVKVNQANAETLTDRMYFDIFVPLVDLETALQIQASRMGEMDFRQATLAREIPRTLSEVEYVENSKYFFAGKFAEIPMNQASRFQKKQLSLREATKQLTIDDVKLYHRTHFIPKRAALIVVGNVEVKQVQEWIKDAFGKLTNPEASKVVEAQLKPGKLEIHWDIQTEHHYWLWAIPGPNDDAHAALTLANLAIGNEMMARVNFEKAGQFIPNLNRTRGQLILSIQTRPGEQDNAMERLEKAIQSVQTEAYWTESMLKRTRRTLDQFFLTNEQVMKTPLPPRISRVQAFANVELQRIAFRSAWGPIDQYRERLQKIEAKSIAGILQKQLDIKQLQRITVKVKSK